VGVKRDLVDEMLQLVEVRFDPSELCLRVRIVGALISQPVQRFVSILATAKNPK
jgi:hypothetical protein